MARQIVLGAFALGAALGLAWLLARLRAEPAVTPAPPSPPCNGGGSSAELLSLATTVAAQDSGLLGDLLPRFRQATGLRLDAYPLERERVLDRARRGFVDAVLVDAPAAERSLVAAGDGIEPETLFCREFVLVGPREDPAGVARARTAREAMRAIARAGLFFASRGDDSDAHAKERDLWHSAGVNPSAAPGGHYLSAHAGVAPEKHHPVGAGSGSLTTGRDPARGPRSPVAWASRSPGVPAHTLPSGAFLGLLNKNAILWSEGVLLKKDKIQLKSG
jgi:hypothetical protein